VGRGIRENLQGAIISTPSSPVVGRPPSRAGLIQAAPSPARRRGAHCRASPSHAPGLADLPRGVPWPAGSTSAGPAPLPVGLRVGQTAPPLPTAALAVAKAGLELGPGPGSDRGRNPSREFVRWRLAGPWPAPLPPAGPQTLSKAPAGPPDSKHPAPLPGPPGSLPSGGSRGT